MSEIVSRVLSEAVDRCVPTMSTGRLRCCSARRFDWKSVKAALAAGVTESGRFERVSYGVYRSVAID